MPRKQKKYHFIYRTTNLVNQKFYVGMHSTDNLEDGYFGSGKILNYSVKKHGLENHKIEILEFCDSRESLRKREAEIVTEELLTDPLCMNLTYGGEGGWEYTRKNLTSEQRSRMGRAGGKVGMTNGWKNNPGQMEEVRRRAVEKAASDEAIEKRKKTFAEKKHQSGSANSQFGTCWIFHELIGSKKCKKDLLPEFIEQGWIKGRR